MPLLPLLLALLAASLPVAFALAALRPGLPAVQRAAAWALAGSAALIAGATVGAVEPVVAAMAGLVSLVGGVVARFSDAYLDGDPRRDRYARWLAATLAAVTALVITDHLLLVAAGWTLTSLCLQRLLTHFDRPAARLAAREKFLVSRAADLALLGALALIHRDLGTLSIRGLEAALADRSGPTTGLHAAALLLVGCVALKTAQLPFHGWLLRVMEAPTPVSALLHAGVVNLGGFVLLRLAPLMSEAVPAQTLLVAIGATTAVLAGLICTTQPSVKGTLAWSTVAQMGFMLLQCGLGAWPLALLHLLAHSLYKAHAFLSSGSTVERARALGLASPKPPAGLGDWGLAAGLAVVGVAAVGAGFGADPTEEPALFALATVLSLAVAPLLLHAWRRGSPLPAAAMLAVAALYFTWHGLFGAVVPPGPADGPRIVLVLTLFGAAFVAQALLQVAPGGAVSRALYPRLAAGLHLDAWFTRLTLGR